MLNPETKLTHVDDTSYRASMITLNEKYSMRKPQIQCKTDSKNGDSFSVNLWKADGQKKTCSAKKKLHTDNCCFSMTRRRCRSASPSPPVLTDVPAKISQTTKTQTLRMENLTRCKKLLRCNGYPNKVSIIHVK